MTVKKITCILMAGIMCINLAFSNVYEYVVKRNDVLWKIGEHYGVWWGDIATSNQLANPNLIFPDQRLLVPMNINFKNALEIVESYDSTVLEALIKSYNEGQFKSEQKIIYYEMISFLADYYLNHQENEYLVKAIDDLICDSEKLWDQEFGGYWDGSPLYPEYMRTSMFTRALADTINTLADVDKGLIKIEWLNILKRNAEWLLGDNIAQVRVIDTDPHVREYSNNKMYNGKQYALWKHSASSNQNIAKMTALYKSYRVLGEKKFLDGSEDEWKYICENQWVEIDANSGYFMEHGHYDVGYTQVSLWLLGDHYFENQNFEVAHKIVNMWNTVKIRIKNDEMLLDTSDSYIVTDKIATLSIPTAMYLGISNLKIDLSLGTKILETKYHKELIDGLLDSGGKSSLELTASDYYLRIGSIKKYIKNFK